MNKNPIPARARKLSRLNIFSHWEVAELPHLLMPDEQVLCMISGFYVAGTATLCVTSHRLLLIDKKLVRLSFEDVRFEAIREVSYSRQLFVASVKFYYSGRELKFRSWYRRELRTLAEFVQNKMFEHRREDGASVHADTLEPAADAQLGRQAQPTPLTSMQPSMNTSERSLFNRQWQRPLTWSREQSRFIRWQRVSRFIGRLPILAASNRLP